jgi:DNA mismatch repair protein MSH5
LHDFDPRLFQHLARTLNSTIDWKESKQDNKISIHPGVSAELDNLRRRNAELPGILDRVAVQLQKSMNYSDPLQVVYWPQLGFLLVTESHVPSGETSDFAATDRFPPEWDFQFHSEQFVYWKCPEMRDLDHHLGDVASWLADVEMELVVELAEAVLEHEGVLVRVHDCLSELVGLLMSYIVLMNLL